MFLLAIIIFRGRLPDYGKTLLLYPGLGLVVVEKQPT
jgi:hypothetical protein